MADKELCVTSLQINRLCGECMVTHRNRIGNRENANRANYFLACGKVRAGIGLPGNEKARQLVTAPRLTGMNILADVPAA
jgi:hypothetical protein